MRKYLARNAPLFVGMLLLWSGLFKLLLPAEAIAALGVAGMPHSLADYSVGTVTVIELYLGFILIFKLDLKAGLALASGLFLVFTIFLSYLATLANPPSCGCLGLTAIFESSRQNALFGLVRNCLILWLLKGAYDHYFPQPANAKGGRPSLC